MIFVIITTTKKGYGLNLKKDRRLEKMKAYVYGMKQRPFSLGCQPTAGLLKTEDDTSGKFWDILYYRRKLKPEEVAGYELVYLGIENI